MHGGLSPNLIYVDQLRGLARPSEIPDSGILCDLVWSDPDKDIDEWGDNNRGCSYTFGEKVVYDFNKRNELNLIVRGHQVMIWVIIKRL